MKIYKGKTRNIRLPHGKEYDWFTLEDGDNIPDRLLHLFEEVKEESVPKPKVEKPKITTAVKKSNKSKPKPKKAKKVFEAEDVNKDGKIDFKDILATAKRVLSPNKKSKNKKVK